MKIFVFIFSIVVVCIVCIVLKVEEYTTKVETIRENRCVFLERELTERCRELALIISAECLQCEYFEKLLVASVVINRLNHPDYPKTLSEVIKSKNAFKGYNGNQYSFNQECYDAAYQTINDGVLDGDILFFYLNKNKKPKYIDTILYREKYHNFGF